jgi:hypothetical protein
MRHDPLSAFYQALRLGPGYCPPDLFEGSVGSIVRGLKVHANNVSHARHVALEETYSRLLDAMGLEAFHYVAECFLADPRVLNRSLDCLGKGFDQLIEDPAQRDLARAEWLWLESFRSPEAEAVTLAELAAFDPERLLASSFRLHPAARWTTLERPAAFSWGEGDGELLLITRPDAELHVRRIADEPAALLASLTQSRPADELLESDPSTLVTLVGAGAIVLEISDEA